MANFLRGDIVLTQFPFTDLKGSAVRPAVVVSATGFGRDIILAAISSVVRGGLVASDVFIDCNHPEFSATGLRVTLVARMHKLATVEHSVIVRRLGRLGPQLQSSADGTLRRLLGF